MYKNERTKTLAFKLGQDVEFSLAALACLHQSSVRLDSSVYNWQIPGLNHSYYRYLC